MRVREILRLAHLLRVSAYTVTALAADCSGLEAARLTEIARQVENMADELDEIGEGDDSSPSEVDRPRQ